MVIDTSAILAILGDEPERRRFNQAVHDAETHLMLVVSFVEAAIVLQARHGDASVRALDNFLARAQMEREPVDPEQADLALQAFRQYERGRRRAALNFGDCFSYALAQATGEPFLFRGNDFALTDLMSALDPL